MGRGVTATDCRKRPTPGALALVDWLEKNAQGTFWGIMRCERRGKNSASLHAEGRAVDWHLDAARPADRRKARRLIDLWLATDRAGNEHALARRMGIQEIIWNCHSWWSGSDGMGNYSACYTERRGPARASAPRSGRANASVPRVLHDIHEFLVAVSSEASARARVGSS